MDDDCAKVPTGGGHFARDDVSDRIRAVVDGDREAVVWLAEWLTPLMLSWARLQLRTGMDWSVAPEDVVQDVWIRVLPKLGSLRGHEASGGRLTPALIGTVRRALRNRVLDERRSASRRAVNDHPMENLTARRSPESSSGPVARALRSERRQLLQLALDRLSRRERELYTGRLFEELSLAELADLHGMTRDAVIKARQRVRKKLGDYLAPQLLDELEDCRED